ncbi:MAG: desulfoferrodoxin family protein [Oscillospiraceae bacterium]|nr:desulfoferrodoxin family protein [Oscillospiraceae bacterium]
MKESRKFYFCEHCKKVISILEDPGVDTVCCGDVMKELVPHTKEAGNEKHLPVVSLSEKFFLDCEGIVHPMQELEDGKIDVVCELSTDKEAFSRPMQEITKTDLADVAAQEQKVTVDVGSVPHPMTQEHSIQWVYLQTKNGGQRKIFKPGDKPQAVFVMYDDEPVAVFSYCNLHGLWKTEL